MKRRSISAKERTEIFAAFAGVCHICGFEIDGGREAWQADHIIPLRLGGDDERGSANIQPAHDACHSDKTREDVRHISKSKRMRQREMGIKKTVRNPLPGSKASRWKKRLDGTVVRRD